MPQDPKKKVIEYDFSDIVETSSPENEAIEYDFSDIVEGEDVKKKDTTSVSPTQDGVSVSTEPEIGLDESGQEVSLAPSEETPEYLKSTSYGELKRQQKVAPVQSYEQTQKALSGIDKEISSNQQSGRFIDKNKQQKLKALEAQREVVASSSDKLISETEKDVSRVVSEGIGDNWEDFLNEEGNVDVSKVGDFARAESIKYGVPEDGYFFDRVKNAAQSKVELEKIAPSVEENLPDIYKEMYGVKPEDAAEEMLSRDDLKKSLGIAKLDANFSLQMEQLNKDIERSSGEQMDKISQERYGMPVEEYATQIGKEYSDSQSQLEAKYAPLINEGGQFIGTQEQYSAYKQETEELNKSYETIFGDFVSQNMRDVAAINNKANRRFRRQQDELFAAYKTEYADKAKGINPLLQERHQKAYGKALEKAMKAEGVSKETKAMISGGPFGNVAANLTLSTYTSGLASNMTSLMRSMGMKKGGEFFEQIAIDFDAGDTELDGFKDWLDPKKALKSVGSTLGGMTPMLATSIPVGMVTGGLGGGAMLTTLASGAAGFGVETMSITQDAYDQKFKETGSAVKAEEAAAKSLKGQIMTSPLYAFEMLPFFGDVGKQLAKVGLDNVAARFVAGGAVETVTEVFQEYSQQLFEKAIADDKQLSDAFDYASVKGFKHTVANVALTTIALGGGGASLDIKTSKEDMAKSLAMRVNIGNLTESAMEQKMLKMTVNSGEKFSKAFVATQLMEGNITEEQATKATLAIESSVSTIKKGKEYNLDNKNNYILATLDLKLKAAKAKAEAESDPMMKGIAERKVKNIEKQSQQLMEQGNADVAVVTYPDGDFDILTHDEARLAMSKDEFMKSFASGDLKVEAMGNGQSKLMSELEEKSKPFAPKEEVVEEGVAPDYKEPTVVSTPTPEKYATINRNDGKGTITLTEEQYKAEMEMFAPVEEAVVEEEVAPEDVIYEGEFVDSPESLKQQFPAVHENEFYHHSTVAFKPKEGVKGEVGKKAKMKVIGRITTDKVDALLVESPDSNNEFPHITLSTSEGVKPFEVNSEISNNPDKVEMFDSPQEVDVTRGYFDGKTDIISPKKKQDAIQERLDTKEQGREEDPGQVQEPEVSEEEGDADSVLQEKEETVSTSEDKLREMEANARKKHRLNLVKRNRKLAAIRAVRSAMQSLSGIAPDVKIVVHDTAESYAKASEEIKRSKQDLSKGTWDPTTNTIHINLDKAGSRTVAHETFHALLFNRFKDEGKIQVAAEKLISELRPALRGNSKLTSYLDEFATRYSDQDVISEEQLAELIGIIAENYNSFNAQAKRAVENFINTVISALGMDKIEGLFPEKISGNEAANMMTAIGERIAKGEVITEEDVSLIEAPEVEIDEKVAPKSKKQEDIKKNISDKVGGLNNAISNAITFASESSYPTNIDFKNALQDRFKNDQKEIKKNYGVKLFTDLGRKGENQQLKEYLVDAYINETLIALQAYPDALGWYDAKTKAAMSVMSLIHPELATDKDAEQAFKIVLAITSNGNKVFDNFKEVNRQYEYFKENGRFDEKKSIGTQSAGIKASLKLVNNTLEVIPMSDFSRFLNEKFTVRDLKYKDKNGKTKSLLSGFLTDTEVYGASIFGAKIGNGFYMNLNGVFDQLTMDRWFIRQYGRLTGTLIDRDAKKVSNGETRLKNAVSKLSSKEKKVLSDLIPRYSSVSMIDLANAIERLTVKADKREIISEGNLNEVRKSGNSLAKNNRGEVEAPKGGSQRAFIIDVFDSVQERLKNDFGIDITIADLQAVNWYPEKALYKTFQEGSKEASGKEDVSDNEQPDYETAAIKLAKQIGITESQIKKASNENRRQESNIESARESVRSGAKELGTTDSKAVKRGIEEIKQSILDVKATLQPEKKPKKKKQEVDPKLKELREESIDFIEAEDGAMSDPPVRKLKKQEDFKPKKTQKAYKLFTRGPKGKIYPLFVDANTEVPVGDWMEAVFPDYRFTAPNGRMYVPSRSTEGVKEAKATGDSIKIPNQEVRDMLIDAGFLPKGSKAVTIKAVAARPGWHAGDVPVATHIGKELTVNGKKYKYRGPAQAWAEVEVPADKDWQSIANDRAKTKKDGTINVKTAHVTNEIPFDGFYRYKTNPNMLGNWIISGQVKVNKLLSDNELQDIYDKEGISDIPSLPQLIDKEGFTLADLDKATANRLKDFYPEKYAEVEDKVGDKVVGKTQPFGKRKKQEGAPMFSGKNKNIIDLANRYIRRKGLDKPVDQEIKKLNTEYAKSMADVYEAAKHEPLKKEVQDAYKALAQESKEQFEVLKRDGHKVELWDGVGEPYSGSKDMLEDLKKNKHLYVFSTEQGFGEKDITDKDRKENPMLEDSGYKDVNGNKLLLNDLFRFVHDAFGHGKLGNSFGPIGEENAWYVHSQMFSPAARRAMTSETRGQNSWVNFGPQLRNSDGSLPKKGDKNYISPANRDFAEQKNFLFPDEYVFDRPNTDGRFQVRQKKVKIEPSVIKKNAIPAVNFIKNVSLKAEDGLTMNLDGTKYEGGGLVVPIASINLNQSSVKPSSVSDFISKNKGKLSNDTFKVGLYKFPEESTVSIDLNIIVPNENRKVAVEVGKMLNQESLFDLDSGENVKTGGTGKNTVELTDEQASDLAKDLAENKRPSLLTVRQKKSEEKKRGFLGRKAEKLKFLSNLSESVFENPEAYYEPQKLAEIKDNAKSMADSELIEAMSLDGLNAIMNLSGSTNSNMAVLAAAELINRKVAKGEPIESVVVQLNKMGTAIGQLMRQFGELKKSTPAGYLLTVERLAEKSGYNLSKEDKNKIAKMVGEKKTLVDMLKYAIEKRRNPNISDAKRKALDEEINKIKDKLYKVDKTLSKFIQAKIPMKIIDVLVQTMQGNLLTTASLAVNILGNLAQLSLMVPVKAFTAMFDRARSFVRGGERTSSFRPAAYLYGAKSFLESLPDAARILFTNTSKSDVNELLKGEINNGLLGVRAWMVLMSNGGIPEPTKMSGFDKMLSIISKDAGEKKIGAKTNVAISLILQGTVGISADLFFRALQAGDVIFKRPWRDMSLYEMGKRKGLSGEDLKTMIKYPSKKQLEMADEIAKEATFQEDSTLAGASKEVTDLVTKWAEKTGNKLFVGNIAKLLARSQFPYVKTPANIANFTFKMNIPALSFLLSMYYLKKGDNRKAALNFGIGMTGGMISTVAVGLVANGLIQSMGDDDDPRERGLKYMTFPPGTINKSAIKRVIDYIKDGYDKGEMGERLNQFYVGEIPEELTKPRSGEDEFASYLKLGIPGFVMGVYAADDKEVARDKAINPSKDSFFESMLGEATKLPQSIRFVTQQSFLQGASALLNALTGSEYETDKWMTNTFRAVSSIPLPNQLATISRANRDYLPDYRDRDLTKQFKNVISDKIFFARENTPADQIRIDLWGRKIDQTPEGADPYMYHLGLDPMRQTKAKDHKLSFEVYELYKRTGESSVIPAAVKDYFTLKDSKGKTVRYNLTRSETNRLQGLIGNARRIKAEEIVSSDNWRYMDDEQRVDALSDAYRDAAKIESVRAEKEVIAFHIRRKRGEDVANQGN